jgi:flagellin-like protein
MRKGVSPLIGITLLIVIVVAAAFVFGEWVEPFTREQTDRAEDEAEQFRACTDAQLRFLDVSTSAQQANITVLNAGEMDLDRIEIVALGKAQVIAEATVTGLASSDHAAVQLDTDGQKPDRIVAIPEACPQMTAQHRP